MATKEELMLTAELSRRAVEDCKMDQESQE